MTPPARRLHHLDAARALLLLLGLPFHVATKAIFESDPAATDFQQSLLIGGWASITHVFRMFAFFMLAGYFAGMIRERKGTRAWIVERARRLGLPFVASLLTLGALQYRLQDTLLGKTSPSFLGQPLALDHLWFLVVLLGFCATYAAVPLRWLNPGERVQRAMLLSGPGGLVVLALLGAWGLVRYATEQVHRSPMRRARHCCGSSSCSTPRASCLACWRGMGVSASACLHCAAAGSGLASCSCSC